MSDSANAFLAYLASLEERDRRALAELRRSLSFKPGAYPPAFPYVERFVSREAHAQDAYRLALYLTAGLYALHPAKSSASIAFSLGQLMRMRESESIEKRFIALLGADAENIHMYLRQAVSLLVAEGLGIDYASLLDDLRVWLNPHADERRDRTRQRWARDFYRAFDAEPRTSSPETPTPEKSLEPVS